jgi:hypothetical protein
METHNHNQIPRRWQPIARIVWIGIALLILVVLLAALPPRIDQQLQDPYNLFSSFERLGLSVQFFAIFGTALDLLTAVGFILIGALAFWRKSDDWMVFLVSLTLLVFPIALIPLSTALAEVSRFWYFLILILRGSGFFLLGLTLFLFPDGHFVPSGSRFILFIWIIYPLLWPFFPGIIPPAAFTDISDPASAIRFSLVLLLYGSGIVFQVYRYVRVSTPLQRQQTKWVVYGFGISVAITFTLTTVLLMFPDESKQGVGFAIFLLTAIPLTLLSFLLFPLTLTIAISKERLWDIDVLIRRTLVYGILTGLLALIYFAIVTILQNILSAITAAQSSVAIVLSTLAIAALFNPLRHRIQDSIDRRFYRRKYDAEKALAAFSLTVREDVDLESLSKALLSVVDETMQPEGVSIWLRETPSPLTPASRPPLSPLPTGGRGERGLGGLR